MDEQILFEVDGTNVYRESLDVVAMLILGEPGTDVRLLFLRGTRIFLEAHLQRQNSTRQVSDSSNFSSSMLPNRHGCAARSYFSSSFLPLHVLARILIYTRATWKMCCGTHRAWNR